MKGADPWRLKKNGDHRECDRVREGKGEHTSLKAGHRGPLNEHARSREGFPLTGKGIVEAKRSRGKEFGVRLKASPLWTPSRKGRVQGDRGFTFHGWAARGRKTGGIQRRKKPRSLEVLTKSYIEQK